MPELPEVETIRLGLQKYLVGHRIVGVEVRLKKIVTGDTKHVTGATVKAVRRFGKGLVIDLDNGYSIAAHIKLTGQFIYHDAKSHNPNKIKVIKNLYSGLPNKWTHVIFYLDKDAKLYYNDFRQFGWIKIIKSEKLKDQSFFRDIGPELIPSPDSGQARMTQEMFEKLVSSSKISIKPLLMDQKKIGGVGNIYANDALNLARINPSRKAQSLSKEEVKTLFHALETVLKKGLETGGASELSYVNVLGEEGGYQHHFIAYGRDGKSCKNCGTSLKKIMLGGRGTYFCPSCQI